MLIYCCDRCGKFCNQVLHISVDVRKVVSDYENWSACDMNDKDYCQDCLAEIAKVANSRSESND